MGKLKVVKKGDLGFLKGEFTEKDFVLFGGAFPSLEEILEKFLEKNKIPKPRRTVETKVGIIIIDLGNKGLFTIYSRAKESLLNPRLIPYIGSPGQYTSTKVTYGLDGELLGEPIHLKAEIEYTEDFEMKEDQDSPTCFVPQPHKSGERTYINREDDNRKYWFLADVTGHLLKKDKNKKD